MEEKNTQLPKVSVVITTFNRALLLSRAIDSVIKQTYNNVEIIIVDDCSSDTTSLVVSAYLSDHRNIIYLKNKENLGAPSSRNIGVEMASGVFLTGLDDDDEFTPDRVEQLVENYSDKWSFLCTGFSCFKNNRLLPVRNYQEVISLNNMLFSNRSSNHGFLLRSKYLSINGQDPHLFSCQDYDFWLRMIEKFGPALRLSDPTYIIHDNHGLERISDSSNALIGLKQFIKKHKHMMSIEQYNAQQLNLYIKKQKPLSIKIMFELMSAKIIWKTIKYYLMSNFKVVKAIDQKLLMLKSKKY